jgi:Flp pilus assembly protein TadG
MRPMQGFDSRRLGARQRGSALIEFSLAIPILVSLFLGVWQFGYAYYLYGELEQAVRAGGRYASLASYDAANPSGYQNAVKNVVVYADPAPAGGAKPVVPGLLPSNVTVDLSFTGAIPSAVTVSISGYKLPGMFATIVLNGKPRNRFPYLGNWAPA